MKNIDVKSLLIGILATALLFACADADKASPSIVSEAKAATGVNDKWDDNQLWEVASSSKSLVQKEMGWEPFANEPFSPYKVLIRRRVK
jgi:hypothetical protein